jgi:hypothetical protein
MDYNKIGAIILLVLMGFFINIFYYLSWMINDWFFTEKNDKSLGEEPGAPKTQV